ncbi:MAG: hypothetical protein K2X87_06965 [Gemmataceae bacterium]|nr:hypothetical protein [Gemmataceae bacterium]
MRSVWLIGATTLLAVAVCAVSTTAQDPPAKDGLIFSVEPKSGKTYPIYVYRPNRDPLEGADIHAAGRLDKLTYPGDPNANPPTYPQIKFAPGAKVTMTVEKLVNGKVQAGSANTYNGSILGEFWEAYSTDKSLQQPSPPAPPLTYFGYSPGSYRVTIKSTVVVTKAAGQPGVREAVLSNDLVIPPP